ncbi:unnamed protein product [Linum trigynum]|uniref:Uncharacterized protein n=1 Tax=Linum trigynum TaxID=586398 RepID=A0AAV2DHD3_9ROSI
MMPMQKKLCTLKKASELISSTSTCFSKVIGLQLRHSFSGASLLADEDSQLLQVRGLSQLSAGAENCPQIHGHGEKAAALVHREADDDDDEQERQQKKHRQEVARHMALAEEAYRKAQLNNKRSSQDKFP